MERIEKIDTKSFANKSILLVEDNKLNVFFVKTILEDWSIKVHIASNGKEALELLNQVAFNLVLMDFQLPILNGFITTKKIRGYNDDRKWIPIIVFSGSEIDEDIWRDAMINDFLFKPFSKEQLYDVISKVFKEDRDGLRTYNFEFNDQLDKESLLALYDGDLSHAFTIIEIFVDTINIEFNRLRQAIESENKLQIQKQIHKMKPSFSMVGLTEITRMLDKVEKEMVGLSLIELSSEIDIVKRKYSGFSTIIKNDIVRYKLYKEK